MAARSLMAVAVAGLLAGCSDSDEVQPPAAAGAEVELRERVHAYWNTRSAGALDDSLAYYEPSFRRLYSPREFEREFARLNRFAPRLRSIAGIELGPSGDRAKVSLDLEATLDDPEFGSTRVESEISEPWVLVNGRWWKRGERPTPTP